MTEAKPLSVEGLALIRGQLEQEKYGSTDAYTIGRLLDHITSLQAEVEHYKGAAKVWENTSEKNCREMNLAKAENAANDAAFKKAHDELSAKYDAIQAENAALRQNQRTPHTVEVCSYKSCRYQLDGCEPEYPHSCSYSDCPIRSQEKK